MNKAGMFLAMAEAMSGGKLLDSISTQERPEKKCLTCGAKHNHNNSFCSAECCKEYKKPKEATE